MPPKTKSKISGTKSGDARKRRGSQTKENILQVASQLFDQKGYDRTSMNEIAEALGITKPSLYYHFKDKERLVLAVVQRASHSLLDDLQVVIDGEGTALEKLRKVLRVYGLHMQTESMRHLVMADERILAGDVMDCINSEKKRLNQFVSKLIDKAMADGHFPPGDTTIKTYAIFGIYNWMAYWSQEGKDLDHILDVFFSMAIHGLAGPDKL